MKKKTIKVIHVEFLTSPDPSGRKHFYFGSKIAVCRQFDRRTLGCTYGYLRTKNLAKQPYQNNKCIIRQDTLMTFGDVVNKQ